MTDDYQIGENDIDNENAFEGGLIEFEIETEAVFKRLADDIYESKEAGVREPIQNAITAVKNAHKEGYIKEDEQVVNITVEDSEMPTVTIQDNGVGISKKEVNDVVSVIGRSTNRDEGSVSGKFGMGFLAFYKLVGTDGGFMMHSRSRRTDDDVKGMWKAAGFDLDEEDEYKDILEDEYGTVFELNTDCNTRDLRKWIKKHSEMAEVNIRYEEKNKNGEITYDEEYGNTEITEQHEDDNIIDINDEHFRCVASLSNSIRTFNTTEYYLMNSPVESSIKTHGLINDLYTTIRLKNENGIIIKGPNKGLTPVSDAEYKKMSDNRREDYIPVSDVAENDIQLPKPTGNREKIIGDDKFHEYLSQTVKEEAYKMLVDTINGMDDSDLLEFTQFDLLSDLKDVIRKTDYNFNSIVDNNTDLNNPQILRELFENCNVITEGFYRRSKKLHEVLQMIDKPEDVYMFVTENKKKIKAIRDNFENPVFMELSGAARYELYEDIGFRKVKHVNRYLDDYEEETKDSDDVKDRNVTIRSGKNHQVDTSKMRVGEIPDKYAGSDETLVLFPSSTDKNVTDYDGIVTESVHTCNSLVSIADYLTEFDNIVEIDEYIKIVNSKEITTSQGVLTVRELSDMVDSDEYIVVLDEHESSYIKQNMSDVQSIIYDHINDDYSYSFVLNEGIMNTGSVDSSDDIVYIPNSDDQNVEVYMSVNNGYNYDYKIRGLEDMHILINEFKDDIDDETYRELQDMIPVDLYEGVRKDVKRLIDTELEDTDPLKESLFITDEGELNGVELVEEAKDNELIAHIVTSYEKHKISGHVDSFSDEVCNKIFKVNDDVIYVVLDKSEFDLIRDEVEADVLINSYKTSYSLLSFDHSLRTSELYKKARLDGFENVNFEGKLDIIDELAE